MMLFCSQAMAWDGQSPEELRYEKHKIHEEMESVYSNSNQQGTQNIDERFWATYNQANTLLNDAIGCVSQTDSFVWSHNMANMSPSDRARYSQLVATEKGKVEAYAFKRDELRNILDTAQQAGVAKPEYQSKVDYLNQTANMAVYKKIQDRPY